VLLLLLVPAFQLAELIFLSAALSFLPRALAAIRFALVLQLTTLHLPDRKDAPVAQLRRLPSERPKAITRSDHP
jgi:hypothetical protein